MSIIETSVKGRKKMSGDQLKKLSAAIEDYQKTAAPRRRAEALGGRLDAINPRNSAAHTISKEYRENHQSHADGRKQ